MITFVYLYVLFISLLMISVIDAFLKHISFWKALWSNMAEVPFYQAGMIFAGLFGVMICIIGDIQRLRRKRNISPSDSKSKESNQQ